MAKGCRYTLAFDQLKLVLTGTTLIEGPERITFLNISIPEHSILPLSGLKRKTVSQVLKGLYKTSGILNNAVRNKTPRERIYSK